MTPPLSGAAVTSIAGNTGAFTLSNGLTNSANDLRLTGTFASSSANAWAVGPSGATNPSFNVDASTGSAVTGLNIKSAASAGGLALSIISSGTNENLTLDAKGSGTLTLNGTATGNVTTPRVTTITNATASTTTTTGALQVVGGVGIGGAANVGGALNVTGAVALANAVITLGTNSQATTLIINGGNIGATAGIKIQTNGTDEVWYGSENFVTGAGSISKATIFSASNTFRIFGFGAGTLVTDASGNVTASSDERLKTDLERPFTRTIRDLIDQDGKFVAMPKTFRWRPEAEMDDGEYVGFFAQDYERGVPEAIGTDPRGYKTFSDRVASALLHNTAYDHERRLHALEQRKTQ